MLICTASVHCGSQVLPLKWTALPHEVVLIGSTMERVLVCMYTSYHSGFGLARNLEFHEHHRRELFPRELPDDTWGGLGCINGNNSFNAARIFMVDIIQEILRDKSTPTLTLNHSSKETSRWELCPPIR
ncbi:hypothetical protein MRB53_003550 [Persea americana]|uniref:Uncharacterized protein n=1 Tax=Persea americana TaxID=3435 RepID=A0ACC2MXM8_PERAE|nr:hypothetical protein MRB53_003550 [Persea americana]